MEKFRKRPVVIEAVQFDGTVAHGKALRDEFPEWIVAVHHDFDPYSADLEIKTLEGRRGNLIARGGEWIIKGIKGALEGPDGDGTLVVSRNCRIR